MSCPHGNPIGGCDTCDEVDAAFEAGKRSALAEQPAPMIRGDIRDGLVDDEPAQSSKQFDTHAAPGQSFDTHSRTPQQQEPISKLFGTLPVYDKPTQASKPLTDEQIFELAREHQDWDRNLIRVRSFARAIEAAHGITKGNT